MGLNYNWPTYSVLKGVKHFLWVQCCTALTEHVLRHSLGCTLCSSFSWAGQRHKLSCLSCFSPHCCHISFWEIHWILSLLGLNASDGRSPPVRCSGCCPLLHSCVLRDSSWLPWGSCVPSPGIFFPLSRNVLPPPTPPTGSIPLFFMGHLLTGMFSTARGPWFEPQCHYLLDFGQILKLPWAQCLHL